MSENTVETYMAISLKFGNHQGDTESGCVAVVGFNFFLLPVTIIIPKLLSAPVGNFKIVAK